jgi:hypothetical protein
MAQLLDRPFVEAYLTDNVKGFSNILSKITNAKFRVLELLYEAHVRNPNIIYSYTALKTQPALIDSLSTMGLVAISGYAKQFAKLTKKGVYIYCYTAYQRQDRRQANIAKVRQALTASDRDF